ncbi:MAG: Ig-like domain-containing protein [Patescibacteria group bacterium]|nr:Ig-like domain-containing protein [Patescibacteria group bacterium]
MSHRSPLFAIVAAALFGLCFATPASALPNVTGQWTKVARLSYFPVHTNLLPNGKVMTWEGDIGTRAADGTRSWDPADPFNLDPANVSLVAHESILSKPDINMFCIGHTFLADGSLFVAGGHISNGVGLSRAAKYNYVTNTWTSLPDMNAGRWYPTTTALANGDVLTISGSIDTTVGVNTLPQVMQVKTGTWRDLTGAQLELDLYPRMFQAPNGKVFYAGMASNTRYLDTSGPGAWKFVATRLGAYQDFGSAVMYAPGKILVVGGGQPPVNKAEVIDLNQAFPSWRAVGAMQYARRQLNATLLPDGKVLVTGGTASTGFNDPTGHVDAAELWDPATEKWTTLASSTGIPRVYHSSALLLPDGRVFSTGGNGYPDVELYSPPYLFKGARPAIASAPASIIYGQPFSVGTPDAAAVTKVTLLKIGSVTHAFNQGQVINNLQFTKTTGGLSVLAPPSGNVAPPGYYMLFILNGNGVPSVARFVKISAGPNPTVSISAPANGATVAGAAVAVTASASDNVGVSGVQFKLDGNNLGAEDTAAPYGITWNSTTATDGAHTLTAVARNAAGLKTTSAGVAIKVNNTTKLPDVIVTSLSYANGIFTSTVMNQGTAATPAGVYVGVAYSVDGALKTWGSVMGPLAAGASVTIGTNGVSYVIPSGIHTVTVWADDVNRFAELNETNNQLSKQVSGDTQSPTVSITAPTNNATVAGAAVTLSANAADNVGVAGVQFLISGDYDPPEDTTAPYAIAWDSTAVVDGIHTIKAVARDAAGNTTTSTGVNVTVNNTTKLPDVIVTALYYAHGIFQCRVKNQGTAATPAGVYVGVRYSVDGIPKTWGSVMGPLAAGTSVTINTNGGAYAIPTGAHTVKAWVDDVNRFAELNETNNQLTQSITVP